MVNKNIYGDIYIFNWNVLYTRQTVWAQVSNEKKTAFFSVHCSQNEARIYVRYEGLWQ